MPFSATPNCKQLSSEIEQTEKIIVNALRDQSLSSGTFEMLLEASMKLFSMRMGLIPFVVAAKIKEGGAQ